MGHLIPAGTGYKELKKIKVKKVGRAIPVPIDENLIAAETSSGIHGHDKPIDDSKETMSAISALGLDK